VSVPILAFCIMDAGFAVDANPFVLVFLAVLASVEQQYRAAAAGTRVGDALVRSSLQV
jgi:hypothetical protein